MGPNARVSGRLYTGSGMDAAAVLSVHSIRTFHPSPGMHIRNFTAVKIIAVKIIFQIPKKIYAETI